MGAGFGCMGLVRDSLHQEELAMTQTEAAVSEDRGRGERRLGVRGEARRMAAQTRARVRAARAERDRERDRAAELVIVQLADRDATVAACELAAGEALERLVGELGLSALEASQWCNDLPVREINRLRQLARPTQGQAGGGAAS